MIKHHYGQRWLAKLGIAGWTIGHHIFYAEDNLRLSTTLHEIEHVRQYRRLAPLGIMPLGVILYGIRWWVEFFLGLVCYRNVWQAYQQISFEIEARQAEEGNRWS